MMIARGIACILGAVFLLAGCLDDPAEPLPSVLEWRGTLEGEVDWEHITGVAAFIWPENSTEFAAGAEIEGDEPGATRPWHVHENSCEEGGDIVGSDANYPRLVVDLDGNASAVATVPVAIDPLAEYHVNIHLSEAEMETIIACGNLDRL